MKYQVKVDEQIFNVEILDIHERPMRVLVDGECFEIWPENDSSNSHHLTFKPVPSSRPAIGEALGPESGVNGSGGREIGHIKAPIPGTILSIAVRPGDAVQKGQELCILEAMKMKNLIRSSRAGVISVVHVAPGQIVSYNDTLLEFELQDAVDK